MRISDWSSDVCSSDLQKRYQRGDQDVAQDESDAILTKRKLPMHVAAETIGQIRDHGGDHDQQAPAHEEHHAGACIAQPAPRPAQRRSEEHTSELQSLMRISYAVFCLNKKKKT